MRSVFNPVSRDLSGIINAIDTTTVGKSLAEMGNINASYADKKRQDEYFSSLGPDAKLSEVDFSKLSSKQIDTLKLQHAMKQDERTIRLQDTNDVYNGLLSEGKQGAVFNMSQDSLAPIYDKMGYTPEEVEATKRIGPMTESMQKSVDAKTKMQEAVGRLANSSELLAEETDLEQIKRVIATMKKNGQTPTPKMQEDLRSREAAAVTARQSKRTSLIKSMEVLQKSNSKWNLEGAKADDKTGSGSTGSSKGKTALEDYRGVKNETFMNYDDAFKSLQDHVSPFGSTTNVLDANKVSVARDLLHKQGYTDDEALYAITQQVDNGLFGNTLVSGAEIAKNAGTYREQYKKMHRTAGSKKSGKNVSNMAQKELVSNNAQLGLLREQLANLDKSPTQIREEKVAKAVRGIKIPGGIEDEYVPGGGSTQKTKPAASVADAKTLLGGMDSSRPVVNDSGTVVTGKGGNYKKSSGSTDLLAAAMGQADAQTVENEGVRKQSYTPLEQAMELRRAQQERSRVDSASDRKVLSSRLKTMVNPTGSGGQDPLNLKGTKEQFKWIADTLGLGGSTDISIDPRNLQSGLFSQQPVSSSRNSILQAPQLTPLQMRDIAKQSPKELERTYSKLSKLDKLLLAQYLQAHKKK